MTLKPKSRAVYPMSEVMSKAYAMEYPRAKIALDLARMLEHAHITQRELAKRLGVWPARISQILSADGNPTIATLARIGHALGHQMTVSFHQNRRKK